MTYGEFLSILADVAKIKPFRVLWLTRDLRTADDDCFCPIVAVARVRFGYDVHNHQALQAGSDIGLSSAWVYAIMSAADHGGGVIMDGAPQVRVDLLRACGLPNGEVTIG